MRSVSVFLHNMVPVPQFFPLVTENVLERIRSIFPQIARAIGALTSSIGRGACALWSLDFGAATECCCQMRMAVCALAGWRCRAAAGCAAPGCLWPCAHWSLGAGAAGWCCQMSMRQCALWSLVPADITSCNNFCLPPLAFEKPRSFR